MAASVSGVGLLASIDAHPLSLQARLVSKYASALYDLSTDPRENRDLAASLPAELAALQDVLGFEAAASRC